MRLPLDFTAKLYGVTDRGTTVIITDGEGATGKVNTPGLLFATAPRDAGLPGRTVWKPEKAPTGPVSLIISSADHAAYVYRNGVEIGRASVGGLPPIRGLFGYSAFGESDVKESVIGSDHQCRWSSS